MLDYFRKYFSWAEAAGIVNVSNMHRMGFAYAMNGFIEEADHYFDKMIAYYESLIVQGRATSGTYYDLAGVYAFRGEVDSAMTNLRKFNQQEIFPRWWIEMFTRDPLFNNIRDIPEFQQILGDVENKYQAEHERIRQWLQENDML